jgi:hypothetical protein
MKRVMILIMVSLLTRMAFAEENALNFDGANDYVDIASGVTAPTTTQPVTVEAWVYPTTNDGTRVIASKYFGGNSSSSNFNITRTPEQKILISGNGTNAMTSNGIVPLNNWTHIAVVFNSGTNNTKIYISGTLDISGTLNYNTGNSTTNMRIGEFYNFSSQSFYTRWTGVIDEFRLWDTVRTQEQIAGSMNMPLAGTESGIVAYYGFNHGIAGGTNTGITTLSDLTGHNWNGTLQNFALTGTTSNWVSGMILTVDPPGTPVAVPATNVGYTGFTANWDAAEWASGYYLDVATDGLFTNYIEGYQNKNVPNVTAFQVTGLEHDTDYYYRVRAYNFNGTSASSNVIHVQTPLAIIPDAPVASAASEISYTEFKANWGAVSGADGYYLDVATDASFTSFVTGFNSKDVGIVASTQIIPLQMDTDYFYRVRAYNPAGTSENSNVITVRTLFTSGPVAIAPFTGDGTSGNPYQIATLNNLYWIAANSSVWSKYFIQTADIDASITSAWFDGAGWDPIGASSGTYDGQGHTISGLYIYRPSEDYIGLFGDFKNISNLGIVDCNITGNRYVGSLAGEAFNATNCYSAGSVTGVNEVGGLIGWVTGNLSQCWSNATVTGISDGRYIGGIAGCNDGSINYCFSKGNVSGNDRVGGIAGITYNNINYCYSEADVSGTNFVGGLIGNYFEGEINNSYSTGDVSGTYFVGGIAGGYVLDYVDWEYSFTFYHKMKNCYAKGAVSGTVNSGGLIGGGYDYWKGDKIIEPDETKFENKQKTKGLTILNSFWDIETTGQTTSVGGGTGKNTAEMLNISTYLNAGWDFYGETANGTADIWSIVDAVNGGYPVQSWQIIPSGAGTESEPYIMTTSGNLLWMNANSNLWDKYFRQTADIDISSVNTGTGWRPVGNSTTKFTGHYDGQGHTINGLFIDLPYTYRVGMFGNTIYAEIKNVNIVNANVKGYASVGAVAGYAVNTDIINCSSSGTVTGTSNVGGIAGYIHYESTISGSSSSCNVTGSVYAGGLCGYNTFGSSITDCYSTGSVNSADYAGGFIGYNNNNATISRCYSTGAVSGAGIKGGFAAGNVNGAVVNNSFWDTETSGQISSAGGTGKTTVQMKTLSTFTTAGWDFVGETVNGTNDYWNMGSGNSGYPYLSWQVFSDIEAPQNLTIVSTSSSALLSWTAPSGASSYKIYSAENPYAEFPAGWTLETSISGTSWTDVNATGTKKFYVIVAVSGKEGKVTSKEKVRSLKIKTIKN